NYVDSCEICGQFVKHMRTATVAAGAALSSL
ncbi:MAG: hypothetical protein ACI9G1_001908, partial [Pirellulaceae bacterium]